MDDTKLLKEALQDQKHVSILVGPAM